MAPPRTRQYRIKPKPCRTAFCNNEYRSTTEAKWAVLFHAVGLDYEYEPSHLRIPHYQIDFAVYVEERTYLFEVKYSKPTYRELKKFRELRRRLRDYAIRVGADPNLVFYHFLINAPPRSLIVPYKRYESGKNLIYGYSPRSDLTFTDILNIAQPL